MPCFLEEVDNTRKSFGEIMKVIVEGWWKTRIYIELESAQVQLSDSKYSVEEDQRLWKKPNEIGRVRD